MMRKCQDWARAIVSDNCIGQLHLEIFCSDRLLCIASVVHLSDHYDSGTRIISSEVSRVLEHAC